MMAVVGLINFKAILHAWEAHRHDGIAAAVTFVAALAFAPHLDTCILTGAGLALILYLYPQHATAGGAAQALLGQRSPRP